VTRDECTGLFVGEGSSDRPLADLVKLLFLDRGVLLNLSSPDFAQLRDHVGSRLDQKMSVGLSLMGESPDVVIVHRDTDNRDRTVRYDEMLRAYENAKPADHMVPIIPVRMTEAWLLLDEAAIREVAGNPNGRNPLGLPRGVSVERNSNPKQLLEQAILAAADVTGRKRKCLSQRFYQNRRSLLERLDRFGPITHLPSWQQLVEDVERVVVAITR
jgi:hypothetical protein